MTLGAAAAIAAATAMLPVPAVASPPTGPVVAVVLPPAPFEQVMSAPVTGTVARGGGVGLLTAPGADDPVQAAAKALGEAGVALRPVDDPSVVGAELRGSEAPLLVLLVVPAPGRLGRDAATLVLARGPAARLLQGFDEPRGLASATTRRAGLVSTVDLAPTVRAFLGRSAVAGEPGAVIRIEGRAPVDLVERYETVQPLRLPVGLAVLGVALAALVAGIVLLLRPGGGRGLFRLAGMIGLFAVALPVSLLPAVMVRRPSVASVVTIAVLGAAIVAAGARWLGGAEPAAVVAVVAGAGMAVVLLDGLLGWPGMLMPLLGGNSFEGSRFYGLGNGYGGVFLAGAVLAASRLRPWAGLALLLAAGVLAGLPGFGSNFGTSLTLFAAAGLWLAIRVRGRGAWPGLAGAAAAIGGVGAVVVAHRVTGAPTHVTDVLVGAERSGIGELLSVYLRRLNLNLRSTAASPAAWLMVVALPVGTIMAWKRARPFGDGLRHDPAWRDAAVVLGVTSIVAFLVNDTFGVAGMGFVYLSAALVYPALAMRWR